MAIHVEFVIHFPEIRIKHQKKNGFKWVVTSSWLVFLLY